MYLTINKISSISFGKWEGLFNPPYICVLLPLVICYTWKFKACFQASFADTCKRIHALAMYYWWTRQKNWNINNFLYILIFAAIFHKPKFLSFLCMRQIWQTNSSSFVKRSSDMSDMSYVISKCCKCALEFGTALEYFKACCLSFSIKWTDVIVPSKCMKSNEINFVFKDNTA